jgi:NADH-quinone oxidoreductase subunit E
MQLIKDLIPEFDEIVKNSTTRRSALLPILHKLHQKKGFLTEKSLVEVAEYLQISQPDTFEVATFFALFNGDHIGKNVLLICENISCYLVGGESIIKALEVETGAEFGGNSPDGLFTLRPFSCLGACDKGPSLLLNGELHSNLTIESVKKLVKDCRRSSSS